MITSRTNKRVVAAVRLKKRAMRERDRRFLVEGQQGVAEALAAGADVAGIFHTDRSGGRIAPTLSMAREAGVRVDEVSEDVMAHLTSTVTPQGVVAVVGFVDVGLETVGAEAGLVPILVEVRDPGNAGAVLRSADAAGSGAVVFAGSSVDVYNEKAVRASAGSLFHVPVVRHVDPGAAVADLRGRGFSVLAAAADGERSVFETDLSGPTAVLFGNEARGLGPDVRALADRSVRVPIRRAESLNLAAAATVMLFEAARPRTGGGLSDVVAGAAHDIRSPLAAIRGFGSTLARKWPLLTDEQRQMMLDGIAYDAGRMSGMITQLVDAARLEAGRLSLARMPVDVLGLARRVGEEMSRPDVLVVEVTGEPAVAEADPDRTRTIIGALVEAAQWWGEEGPVRIDVGPGRDGGATVRVSRTGSSLEPGEAASLFAPRAPGTGRGSKVGLFVGSGLARAQGGDVGVESGDDVVFSLSLPSVAREAR